MIRYDEAANLASLILEFRRSRLQELPPALFGEPGWDFLLELFVADAQGTRITGQQICERCSISAPATSRWLMYLTAEGLIIGDGSGNLDDDLTLSASALKKIESLLSKVSLQAESSADR